MRRALSLTLAFLLTLSACSGDVSGPGDRLSLDELAVLAYGALQVGGPGDNLMERLAQLPPELALSGAQAAQIGSLIDAFTTATAADRAALAAIREEVAAARRAGATPDAIAGILDRGTEIRTRLHQGERELHASIMAVLTPAQVAWLRGRTPPPPRPCALTEAQRTEISALMAAYEAAHAADIALVRSVHERARAAQQDGASRAEVAAILDEARAAAARIIAARAELQTAISNVYTTEQRAAGCTRS